MTRTNQTTFDIAGILNAVSLVFAGFLLFASFIPA